ncbi:fucolectin-like isoform X2 [Haliotis rufescens]|uniref:fucolectin-like isoform X2 n=1 Tax=Haliotis rufescens TaxID=6454 RepID=UPI001EB07379|nr:fucolectin-like isoform X2 [Haliotis rufescens]
MFLLNTVLLLAHATFVSGIHNRALGKPTKSSNFTNNKGKAVDGNREAAFSGNSCWESQTGDMQPYWMVDLQSFFLLDYITITNRGDCCGDRMHDLKIEVFADDPVLEPSTPSHLCAMYDGPMPGGATENISCSCAAQGRYIRIRGLDRRDETDLLTLCEVEVFERTPTGCFSTDLHRMVGTRYVGDVIQVDVASAADCSTHCIYNRTCIGFNYNYNTHGCELRVGSAEASSVIGWFYFFKRPCLLE